MKFPKYILSGIITAALSSAAFAAAVVKVNFDSGGLDLKDSAGVSLTAGGNLIAGDGAVIQLGYFSSASTADNNFVGQFIPITGEGSANLQSGAQFDTTVGDDPAAGFGPPYAGQFQISVIFTPGGQAVTPPVGSVLSIRIYDKASLLSPTLNFMTLSNNAWRWKDFADSTSPGSNLDISLADSGIRFENRSGAGGLVSTPNGSPATGNERPNIPAVPEPSSMLLLSIGALVSLKRRRA